VTELKQLIAGLIRGEQTFEVVSAALDQLLGETPDSAPGVARLLQTARDSGLPTHVFAALNGQIGTHVSAHANLPDNADATVFAADGADATVFAGDDHDDPNATVFAAVGVDATMKRDDSRADVDPDATVFDAGADITVMDDEQSADFLETAIFEQPVAMGKTDDQGAAARTALNVNSTVDPSSATAIDAVDTSAEAPTGATWPTALGQSAATSLSTGSPVAGVDREFQEGDLLRGRFELISKLGEGGMGAVWKGKDKLKEEARDRNPFVAIKLLQGDFKSHPEAFIALQRETAKQQRLAHPNIATVFDFDRDDATATVFMTMEVMEGQPMDSYIRKLPADGLSEEEAMPLVVELCAGLSYAHAASLVHSDLKPGNCFYTNEGHIKLLDFGIARASKTKDDAVGETTLFDPGTLGALTPTYASIEMFEGDDPDPRDDIYALGIMTYQLLTGKHPYGKKSAPKAKELGLTVEPIAKLNKRQNKGLARGLAFMREDRAETVEVFLESITRKKTRTGLWVGIATITLALLVAGAWNPVRNFIDTSKREDVIVAIQQGGAQGFRDTLDQAQKTFNDEQFARLLEDQRVINVAAALISANDGSKVENAVTLLTGYSEPWRRTVLDVDAARKAIFGHYERRIQATFSPTDARFDFPSAVQSLGKLDTLYPDSAQVFQLRSTLNDSKRETLASLDTQYKALKDTGKLVPVDKEDDIGDVLLAVKAIDPKHRLLNDKDLPFRFAQEAEKAIKTDKDYPRAKALLVASTAYAPNDGKLKGLKYDLNQILTRIENEKRIADLEAQLAQAEPGLNALPDYQKVRDQLVTLADLNAQSAVLGRIQGHLKSAFEQAFAALIAASKWQESEDLLFRFARLLSIADLTQQRAALSQAESGAGFAPDLAARKPQVDERVASVNALLAKPEFTIDWETELKVPYKELLALQPLGSLELEKVRTDTARLLLAASSQARKEENFNQAREFVVKGLDFYPRLKQFSDENEVINAAEQQFIAKRAEAERLAKIETLKGEFTERATDDRINDANATLQALTKLGLNADDPFFTDTVPNALAASYQRLAKLNADNEKYTEAVTFAQLGLKLAPGLASLSEALKGYQSKAAELARELALVKLFDSTEPINVAAVQKDLQSIKQDTPKRYVALETKLPKLRAEQLRKYARTKNVNISTLSARATEFRGVFDKAGTALSDELAGVIESRLRKADVRSSKALVGIKQPLIAFAKLSPKRHSDLSSDLAAKALAAVLALEPSNKGAANTLLASAKSVFPNDKELAAKKSLVIAMPEITAGLAQLQRGLLAAAAKSLLAAQAKDVAHPDISPFANQISDKRKQADAFYAQHIAKAKDPEGHKLKSEIKKLFSQATALCSDCQFREQQAVKPAPGLCRPGLAGFGAKRAGQCWDQLGRVKGPMMVVVPSGGGSASSFAIGKYEVSQRDFNVFCKATTQCKVVLGSKSRLPATRIAAQVAEAYAKWLSATASRALKRKVVYRLPTSAEWEHAANAGGSQPEKKFNCRVTSGGNIIAGHDLIDATSGHQNGWGLANYVGNAQEFVRDGGAFAARGGDFEVPLTKCDVSTSQPHSGSADATTGFRLVRELG
jgi:serine/threonine protein kinase